jgi:predicted hotdog family 3-hydroxylacyl-ACP dehydratase
VSSADAIDIAALVPHAGAMVLLDRVEAWDADGILCRAQSHLDTANPLRRDGRLAACCGLEYALQAAALHGALLAGGAAQRAGYVAALRGVTLEVGRLDMAAFGELRVIARLERQEAAGVIYALAIHAADGTPLLSGRATIALPA